MEVWSQFCQSVVNNSGEISILLVLAFVTWISGKQYGPGNFLAIIVAFLIISFIFALFGINFS